MAATKSLHEAEDQWRQSAAAGRPWSQPIYALSDLHWHAAGHTSPVHQQ